MDVRPADRNERLVGGKRLGFDLPLGRAIERVADDGSDILRIDMIDAQQCR